MSLFLGIDIGTSSTKALVMNERGEIVGTGTSPHALSMPRDGWSEQEPDWWWNATIQAVRSAAGQHSRHIVAIGLSGQMHGSVFMGRGVLHADSHPLRPAILWNDQRTSAECELIERAVGGRSRLVDLVGNAALTGFTLPKVLWLREHEPDLFERVGKVLLPKDFVRLRLTGETMTDVGDACGTLAFDPTVRAWKESVLTAVGIDVDLWPQVVESASPAGQLSKPAAELLGLLPGITVVAGSGDNQCGAIGAGICLPGSVLATLGTSGVIFAHSETPKPDRGDHGSGPAGRTHSMCAATGDARTPGGWCVTGVMLAAAGSLAWARSVLCPDLTYEDVYKEAAASPPGSDDLIFLPYLSGERCPHPDPHARGAWLGLSARHTRSHMLRAVMEGVTMAMTEILQLVQTLGVPIHRVVLGGGGAKSEFWRQMQADIYQSDVELPNTEEGPALGAAILAAVGVGAFGSVTQACRALIKAQRCASPGPEAASYERSKDLFGTLYPTLAGHFSRSAASR